MARPTRYRPVARSTARDWAIALGVIAVLVGGFVAAVAARDFFRGFRHGPDGPPARQTYTRAEFRDLVAGKTPAGVEAAVGRPESTQDFRDGHANWYYRDATRDPVTGETDRRAQVVFRGGVCVGVNFF